LPRTLEHFAAKGYRFRAITKAMLEPQVILDLNVQIA
jgi:hypothetical protein